MKKGIIIAVSVAAGILVLVLCGFLVMKLIKNNIMDGSGMVNNVRVLSVEYAQSPDEYGRCESYYYHDDSIDFYHDDGTEGGSVKKSCSVDEDFYLALENIMSEYNVREWKDLPESDLEVLDGSTSSMKIEFADSLTIELGDHYEMPDGSWEAVSEIVDLLESYIQEKCAE